MLETCLYAFVRHDAHRAPFDSVYDGPFLVLSRRPKYFVLQRGPNKNDVVSINRLKPAFLFADASSYEFLIQ